MIDTQGVKEIQPQGMLQCRKGVEMLQCSMYILFIRNGIEFPYVQEQDQ